MTELEQRLQGLFEAQAAFFKAAGLDPSEMDPVVDYGHCKTAGP